jgi:hypothetical protein
MPVPAAAGDSSIKSPAGVIVRIVFPGTAPNLSLEELQSRALFIVARDDANDAGLRLPGIRAPYEETPAPKELIVLDGSAPASFFSKRTRVLMSCTRFCCSSQCRSIGVLRPCGLGGTGRSRRISN